MYTFETTSFGYKFSFTGQVSKDEVVSWVEESKAALENAPESFGVLVDMQGLQPVEPEVKALMEEGQKLYKMKGLTRSAVAVDSATLAFQFKRLAKQTGIYEWERYVDASSVDDWEKVALAWINDEVEP